MVTFQQSWVTLLLFASVALQPLIGPVVDAFSLGAEYIGTEAPWFPSQTSRAATCYQYFFALAEANCTVHQSKTLPVRVHNCVSDGASGVLVLERTTDPSTSKGQEGGTAVYRLRIAGPDGLWLLEPTYCRPDFALAMYDLRHPGLFSVELLMLYTSFSFIQPNVSKAVQAPWAGYLTLDVQPVTTPTTANSRQDSRVRLVGQRWGPLPDPSIFSIGEAPEGNASHYLHPQLEHQASLPLCPDAGPIPGRWRFTEWPPTSATTSAAAVALQRTCIWYTNADRDADCSVAKRRQLPFVSQPAALSWQPDGCCMRTFTGFPLPTPPSALQGDNSRTQLAAEAPSAITPQSCLPQGRRVCFVGDSHMRYLLNSLVLWQHGFKTTVNNTIKQILSSESVHYEYMLWGRDWPGAEDADGIPDPLGAANCTDIIANFGQWPASYRSGSAPYSALQYLRQLQRVRRALLAARRARGVRVFWVTTCISSLKARLEAKGIDWRTDPLLTLYNRLALDVMSGELPTVFGQKRLHALEGVDDAGTQGQQQQLRGQELKSFIKGAIPLTGIDLENAGAVEARAGAGGEVMSEREREIWQSTLSGDELGTGRRQGEGSGPLEAAGSLPASLRTWSAGDGEHAAAEGNNLDDGRRLQLQARRFHKPSQVSWQSRDAQGEKRVRQQHATTAAVQQRLRRRRKSHLQTQTQALPRALGQEQLQEQVHQDQVSFHSRSRSGLNRTTTTTSTNPGASSQLLLKWFQQILPSRDHRRLLLLVEQEGVKDAGGGATTDGKESKVPPHSVEVIPVIDTWSFTHVLHDTTWDGVHYTNTGAVGLAQLTAILHALCSETALSELGSGQKSGTKVREAR